MDISKEEFQALLEIQNKTAQQLERLATVSPSGKNMKLNGEAEVLYNKLKSDLESAKQIDDSKWEQHNRSSREFKEGIQEFKKTVTNSIDEMRKIFLEYVQKDKKDSWDWRTIAVTTAVMFALFGFLGQQIAFLWNVTETGYQELKRESIEREDRLTVSYKLEVEDLKKRLEATDINLQREMRDVSAVRKAEIDSLDSMLQREMRLLREADIVNTKFNQDEIKRIRAWKDKIEETQGAIDAEQTTSIKNLKELLDAKAADRFTGSEARMMQKQIDLLEERLSYLTKQAMEQEARFKNE